LRSVRQGAVTVGDINRLACLESHPGRHPLPSQKDVRNAVHVVSVSLAVVEG